MYKLILIYKEISLVYFYLAKMNQISLMYPQHLRIKSSRVYKLFKN